MFVSFDIGSGGTEIGNRLRRTKRIPVYSYIQKEEDGVIHMFVLLNSLLVERFVKPAAI